MIHWTSHSVAETEKIAEGFAASLSAGDVIACRGGMGMGKTAFARGLARGLGLRDDVSSPTFALVHEYTDGKIPLYHFDMYRINSFEGLYSTGFFDYLEQGGVLLIEWSENIEEALPEGTITLEICRGADENTREIRIEGGRF